MSVNSSAVGKKGHSPIPILLAGIMLLVFWLLATMLQIQTSEAFLLKGSVVALAPNWGILKQPIELVQGTLSINDAKGVMWGWGIELIYLVCIIGYEIAHEGVRHSNPRLASWFRSGAIILIAFDAYTNYQYGNLASGPWGQFAFAAITVFITAFFGIVGFRLIEAGLHEWSS